MDICRTPSCPAAELQPMVPESRPAIMRTHLSDVHPATDGGANKGAAAAYLSKVLAQVCALVPLRPGAPPLTLGFGLLALLIGADLLVVRSLREPKPKTISTQLGCRAGRACSSLLCRQRRQWLTSKSSSSPASSTTASSLASLSSLLIRISRMRATSESLALLTVEAFARFERRSDIVALAAYKRVQRPAAAAIAIVQ